MCLRSAAIYGPSGLITPSCTPSLTPTPTSSKPTSPLISLPECPRASKRAGPSRPASSSPPRKLRLHVGVRTDTPPASPSQGGSPKQVRFAFPISLRIRVPSKPVPPRQYEEQAARRLSELRHWTRTLPGGPGITRVQDTVSGTSIESLLIPAAPIDREG